MPDPRRIVTGPLPVLHGIGFSELAMVVAADALVRRTWVAGRSAELLLPATVGGLVSQCAFERELAREGHDRSTLSPDELEARGATFAGERMMAANALLARVAVAAEPTLIAERTEDAAHAARTAFVKLYEAGLLEPQLRVVSHCPRCRTVLDDADIEVVELDGERLTLQLATPEGDRLEVEITDPELLAGAVAVAVPEGHELAGATVTLPVVDRQVPVIADSLWDAVRIVVPAHDAVAHRLAQAEGLPSSKVVFDLDGFVCAEGPLAGLARYAARAAARDLLAAEGVLVAAESGAEVVARCRCCGTVAVQRLGRHWFLRSAALERAAADSVRDGAVVFTPLEARDVLLANAGIRSDWCLSSGVVGGVPVPAGACVECGKVRVEVEPPSSCGACMGAVAAEPGVLDERFVMAIWALALSGWPSRSASTEPTETAVVVDPTALVEWVLPALALGFRLAGRAPFATAVVHPWPDPEALDGATFADEEEDGRVLRLSLLAGVADIEAARVAVFALDSATGPEDVVSDATSVAAAIMTALDDGTPSQAAGLLASALAGGVAPESADRLRALVVPMLGD